MDDCANPKDVFGDSGTPRKSYNPFWYNGPAYILGRFIAKSVEEYEPDPDDALSTLIQRFREGHENPPTNRNHIECYKLIRQWLPLDGLNGKQWKRVWKDGNAASFKTQMRKYSRDGWHEPKKTEPKAID